MGRFPAYLLAALLALVAGAPAAWAQSQAFPTTAGYPYGGQYPTVSGSYGGYGAYPGYPGSSSTTFSSVPYYGSSYGSSGTGYSPLPYGQWNSSSLGYGSQNPYGYAPTSGAYNSYGYAQGYGYPYGQPAGYTGSPFAAPPPFGAPYGSAPGGNSYSPTAYPSYPAPYGSLPPAYGPPPDPYGSTQMASYPYGQSPYGSPPAAYPQTTQSTQTTQATQTGCNGQCTLGQYYYGIGVPSSTPYLGSSNYQITPYNQGSLASALTGVNIPQPQTNQQVTYPQQNIPVSQY
ncbi:MAG TPA: hypothetical protein VII06_19880 [Chloroflexota bacterium]|jgi:hypothetical protein